MVTAKNTEKITRKPKPLTIASVFWLTGEPFIFSIEISKSHPPSKTGNGKILKTIKLIDKVANS